MRPFAEGGLQSLGRLQEGQYRGPETHPEKGSLRGSSGC
jgi:hypothetical protein